MLDDRGRGRPPVPLTSLAGRLLAIADEGPKPVTEPLAAYGSSAGDPPRVDAEREAVRALVTLAQQGDAEAFARLYERHVGTVYQYVYARTGNRHQAEDITSETFLKALRKIDTFTWQGRDIVAWFLTIARNLVLDAVKSAPYRLEVATGELVDLKPPARPGEVDRPEAAAVRREEQERLVAALRRLTGDQAECLVLRFLEGLSLAECAEVLGRSENAVKQLQLRAVRALRKELGRAT